MCTLKLSTTERPTVRLVGQSGNAFMILGLASRAWKKANLPQEDWKKIHTEATSGDYDHLLGTIMEYFDVK